MKVRCLFTIKINFGQLLHLSPSRILLKELNENIDSKTFLTKVVKQESWPSCPERIKCRPTGFLRAFYAYVFDMFYDFYVFIHKMSLAMIQFTV